MDVVHDGSDREEEGGHYCLEAAGEGSQMAVAANQHRPYGPAAFLLTSKKIGKLAAKRHTRG